MIFKEETPVLPPDVLLEEMRLLDITTGDKVPLNGTAHSMLALVDGSRSIREIADTISKHYGVSPEKVTDDLIRLAGELNEKSLLNLQVGSRLRCLLLVKVILYFFMDILTGHFQIPWQRKRLGIDNSRVLICVFSVARQLGPRAAIVSCAVCTLYWVVMGAIPSLLDEALVVALALIISLLVHEAAHAAALSPTSAFISVRGPVAQVQHQPTSPRRGVFVSAAGPLVSGALGLLILQAGSVLNSGLLTLGGMVIALNFLGMTVLAADGRNILRNLGNMQKCAKTHMNFSEEAT